MSDEKPISWLTMPERITGLYLQAGHTRDSFAAAIQMNSDSLQHFECFEDVPTLIELGELANGLHVSKRFLCFGEGQLQAGDGGEPILPTASIRAVLAEVEVVEAEEVIFDRYKQLAGDESCSRTFVLMFIRALRTAIENGADGETAMTRAMVIATQAHVLSRAVAQGVRPVRPERIHHPPNTLSSAAKVEYIAAEIHRLSGIKPPLEPSVLAVALGKRLVPAFDSAASKAETKRQELLGWKPTAQVDGNNLVINGVLKVQAWQERKDADLTEHVLQAAQKVIHNTPDHEVPSSFIAFLKGNGDVVIAMPTELGMETVEDWVRPALRDLARRICATAIYVVSDGSIAVCGPRGRRERRTITVDVENIQEDPPKRTYVASTGDDGTLGAWSEDSTCARFSDLLS